MSIPRKLLRLTRADGATHCWGLKVGGMFLALMLAGCTHYDITLQNGDRIRAKNKPKLNDRGEYVFKDLNDREMAIKSMRVRQIEPARRGESSAFSFEK